MDDKNNIALLIDADNTQAPMVDAIMARLLTLGRIPLRRVFGNWRKDALKPWVDVSMRHAIKAEQQFDYVKGKNATDMALTIAAMDLLHSGHYDTFAIVSSDSDFTPLALRLREAGVRVIGIGRENTPVAFQSCCDSFIPLESLAAEKPVPKSAPKPAAEKPALKSAPKPAAAKSAPASAKKKPASGQETHKAAAPQPVLKELHAVLGELVRTHADAHGYASAQIVGQEFMARFIDIPGFSIKNYGGRSSVTTFCGLHPGIYKVKKMKGKGTFLRCLEGQGAVKQVPQEVQPQPQPQEPQKAQEPQPRQVPPHPQPELKPVQETKPQAPQQGAETTSPEPRAWNPDYLEHVVGKVQQWFREAHEALAVAPGAFVMLNRAGSYLRKTHENFNLPRLGYAGPMAFLAAFPELFELRKDHLAFRLR